MNILITGHTGFIGCHLTPALIAQNHTIIGIKRTSSDRSPDYPRSCDKITGKSSAIERLLGSLIVSNNNIVTTLNWQPPFTVEQGLEATAKWYKSVDRTLVILSELQTVAQEATDAFSRLSSLQLKVATAQPEISAALARLVIDSKERIAIRIPAWQRSIEEILLTWRLN